MTHAEISQVADGLREVLSDGIGAVNDKAGRERLFAWVYENNQWGKSPTGERFFSDSPEEQAAPYRSLVSRFIRTAA